MIKRFIIEIAQLATMAAIGAAMAWLYLDTYMTYNGY